MALKSRSLILILCLAAALRTPDRLTARTRQSQQQVTP